jgi:hypothetical protein
MEHDSVSQNLSNQHIFPIMLCPFSLSCTSEAVAVLVLVLVLY